MKRNGRNKEEYFIKCSDRERLSLDNVPFNGCGATISSAQPIAAAPKGSKKKVISIIIGLLLVAGIGTTVYFLLGSQLGKSTGLFPVMKNRKVGFMDKSGKIVISPQFDFSLWFAEGMAPVQLGGKWGFIDKSGKMVINPQFDKVEGMFSEGLAGVATGGKWGFIDKSGKMVINPQFDDANIFGEGLAAVKMSDKFGFIDKKGEFVINPQFDEVALLFAEGLAGVKTAGKWGFIDKSGKMVINPQFDNVEGWFSEGLAPVKTGNKSGYIDKTGKYIINPQYDKAMWFIDGLALVIVNGNSDYIDKSGKVIAPKDEQKAEGGNFLSKLFAKGDSSGSSGNIFRNKKDLTRDYAAELIMQNLGPLTVRFMHAGYMGFTTGIWDETLTPAQKQKMKDAGYLLENGFSEKAKPFVTVQQEDSFAGEKSDFYYLQLATIDKVVVTGITAPSDMMGIKFAEAQYEVTYKPNALAEILQMTPAQLKKSGKEGFVLYDDGWRIGQP